GAVELDSPDGMGLDLERPDLDRRLAGARVPNGGLWGFLLADRREGLVALLPGDGARLGRLGHVVLALHHSVPFRSRTLSGGAAHVLVGRSAHGVVLLLRPGAFPLGVGRSALGTLRACRRAILAQGDEPGYVVLPAARFTLPTDGG